MEDSTPKLTFATWLRAFSMLLILACHYCAACAIPAVSMLGQVFNIGVYLFFILSGFLTGYKGIAPPYKKWYLKRIRRIFAPYWLFLFCLAAVHLAKGMSIFTQDWLLLWIGAQGTVVGVWGAGQTWFISVLLLCYLISPAILSANRKVREWKNRAITLVCALVVCILPVVYALAEPDWVYTLLTPVSLYTMSCVYGVHYRENQGHTPGKKYMLLPWCVVAAAFGARFAARMLMDGTILYNRIIVPYTHMIAAAAIWVIFEKLFDGKAVPKAVQRVSDISFEIYLWHCMFIVGPVSIFEKIGSWSLACAATTIVVLVISLLSSRVNAFISKRILTKRA